MDPVLPSKSSGRRVLADCSRLAPVVDCSCCATPPAPVHSPLALAYEIRQQDRFAPLIQTQKHVWSTLIRRSTRRSSASVGSRTGSESRPALVHPLLDVGSECLGKSFTLTPWTLEQIPGCETDTRNSSDAANEEQGFAGMPAIHRRHPCRRSSP